MIQYHIVYFTDHFIILYTSMHLIGIDCVTLVYISRIAERLGRGEFGDVVKGYWKSADYSVEVALKTLSGQQGEDGRRKLLQEAAIMSQFKHPNVVKLYGVVSDDHEVIKSIGIQWLILLNYMPCF